MRIAPQFQIPPFDQRVRLFGRLPKIHAYDLMGTRHSIRLLETLHCAGIVPNTLEGVNIYLRELSLRDRYC